MKAQSAVRLLFGVRARVPRGAYLGWGIALAILKFALDSAVVVAFTGVAWSPAAYFVPAQILHASEVIDGPEGLHLATALVALPFFWIGLSMSVRRAADAGISPWWGTVFAVPVFNYLAIAALCLAPSSPEARWEPPPLGPYREAPPKDLDPASAKPVSPRLEDALRGVLGGMGLGIGMLWVSVYCLKEYGIALFFLTPLAMGATAAIAYNRTLTRGFGRTIGLAVLTIVLTGCAAFIFAFEGLGCLLMAAPIAVVLAILGAMVGYAISAARHRPVAALMLFLPGVAFGESRLGPPPVHDVTSEVEIDAPPERVWPNVIGFSELEEKPEWFFRMGIAYPVRATIAGQGVGAVRRCEFSTGAFVEPITAWQPPSRLAFDVAAQPASMTEWSPYGAIRAPHLQGYMVSKGGEFDLTPLPGGRTRLRGTTHYTLAIEPAIYWIPCAEALLHAIHLRVLRHIKHLSESPAG